MVKVGHVEACLRTDTGLVRGHNEDFVYAWEPKSQETAKANGWLYIVADGVGGADAGEIASQYASERMTTHFLQSKEPDWQQRIYEAMQWANTDLRRMVAERDDNTRMATTMVTAVVHDSQVTIGNVGDSRAYHWRKGTLYQVTKDQSLVAKLVEEGAITAAEAEIHPRRNVILYSLGSERKPQIDLFDVHLQADDIILLCSDGLTRHVTDEEINEMIGKYPPNASADRLIRLANNRGGEDNISVILIHYGSTRTKSSSLPDDEDEHFEDDEYMVAANTAVSQTITQTSTASPHRKLLWVYTVGLAILMAFLMLIFWIILRV